MIMQGWKTWTGVATGLIGAAAAGFGMDLTPQQLDAIQLLAVSLIGVGLGSKADKVKQDTEKAVRLTGLVSQQVSGVASKTETVVQKVANVDAKIEPEKTVQIKPLRTGPPM